MTVGSVSGSYNCANLKVSSDPYEKMKLSIENQIKKVENSKESREAKDKKIKDLREMIKQIEDQQNQEKTEKTKEEQEKKAAETREAKNEEIDNNKSPEGKESAAVNKNVVKGLVGASRHMKGAKIANKYYEEYSQKGDIAKMKNALKYVSSEMKEVHKSSKLIKKGLQEYSRQAEAAAKNKNQDTKKQVKNVIKNENKDIKDNIQEKSVNDEKDQNIENVSDNNNQNYKIEPSKNSTDDKENSVKIDVVI